MAKSARHKKLRRQEKAKSQLAGGKNKKLIAKSQSLVTPILQTKKIVIRDQLKQAVEGELTTRRKQNLQDLLSNLHHHNGNIKKDALNGLQELITSQTSVLLSNLERILERIGSLTNDLEGSVRKENLKTAEMIFSRLSENEIRAFWPLILTHVKCSLTNLRRSIRKSCLAFVQLLFSHFPGLVSSSIKIILPAIMALISSPTKTSSGSSANKLKSHVKTEISEKHNDLKERLLILSLVGSCLTLHLSDENNSRNELKSHHEVSGEECKYLGLYYSQGYTHYYNSQSLMQEIWSKEDDRNTFWMEILPSVLPVLFETWVEVGPTKSGSTDDSTGQNIQRKKSVEFSGIQKGSDKNDQKLTNLSRTAVEALQCIVDVLSLVLRSSWQSESVDPWTSAREDNVLIRQLRKTFGGDLNKYFFSWLPFTAVQDDQRSTVATINIKLFQIAADLRLMDGIVMKRLDNFISVVFKKINVTAGQCDSLLKVLRCLKVNDVSKWMIQVIEQSYSAGHRDVIVDFFSNLTSLNNRNDETLINTLPWNELLCNLKKLFPDFTPRLLSLFISVATRKIGNVKSILQGNMSEFQDFVQRESNDELWDTAFQLLYYSDCLESFTQFENVPPALLQTAQLLKT